MSSAVRGWCRRLSLSFRYSSLFPELNIRAKRAHPCRFQDATHGCHSFFPARPSGRGGKISRDTCCTVRSGTVVAARSLAVRRAAHHEPDVRSLFAQWRWLLFALIASDLQAVSSLRSPSRVGGTSLLFPGNFWHLHYITAKSSSRQNVR